MERERKWDRIWGPMAVRDDCIGSVRAVNPCKSSSLTLSFCLTFRLLNTLFHRSDEQEKRKNQFSGMRSLRRRRYEEVKMVWETGQTVPDCCVLMCVHLWCDAHASLLLHPLQYIVSSFSTPFWLSNAERYERWYFPHWSQLPPSPSSSFWKDSQFCDSFLSFYCWSLSLIPLPVIQSELGLIKSPFD